MKSQWNAREANSLINFYKRQGVSSDVALRVYSTRLLGRNSNLVLHGGGNTSVKTTIIDLFGDELDVIRVKGSGWNMDDIEPRGLPALKLRDLLKLRTLEQLSDEEMVNYQRGCLIDSTSPNPSVETLLHAFLPHKYVDHTHSTAILTITDQPNGVALCREIFGDNVALVPYVMPGFQLALKAAEVFDSYPKVKGLILLKHGIFTFGDDARQAYQRMIGLVSQAEKYIKKKRAKVFRSAILPKASSQAFEVAPILRGLLAGSGTVGQVDRNKVILAFRTNRKIRNYTDGEGVARYSQIGVVTPDHTIRTKNWPLLLSPSALGELDSFRYDSERRVLRYIERYQRYFVRHNGKRGPHRIKLDPFPRVILVPGLGLFGVGKSAKDAGIAADIAENTIEVITAAEAIGRYRPVNEADMFDIEYWSLEQAKLGRGIEKALSSHVVVVTGGGSGIGAAVAHAFAAHGAVVAVLDRDKKSAEKVAAQISGGSIGIECDVTNTRAVRNAFNQVCTAYGGVDIVVSNAGAAWQGDIGAVKSEHLRESFEVNFFAHQTVAQNAVGIMKAQDTGGSLLFNASKQSINPGKNFGPYGLPKATTVFLARQYALEYGQHGIRSNVINADRVYTGMFKDGLLEERAASRGLSTEQYLRDGNLLKLEVMPEDVAKAFVDLALLPKTTAAILTVDGGNIEAAVR